MSVYFEFGKSNILPKQMRRIRAIPHNIYVNNLDSVHFVGMADSVGSIKANLSLGYKRAKTVSKVCKKMFPTSPKIVVSSRGELRGRNMAGNRRVDVIFFSKPEEVIVVEDTFSPPIEFCYKRADTLLHRSFVHTVQHRRKDYVSVETNFADSRTLIYYAGKTTKTKDWRDSMSIYRLRWRKSKLKTKRRNYPDYYVRIPKNDYDNYAIFTIDSTPCDGCENLLADYSAFMKKESIKCHQVDRFLMDHLDMKHRFFRSNKVTVRAERSYIDKSATYFEACDTFTPLEWRGIRNGRKWKRRHKNTRWQNFLAKIFKKRRAKLEGRSHYYYTELTYTRYLCLNQIVREMDCCIFGSEPSECDKCYGWGGLGGGGIMNCAFSPKASRYLFAELGNRNNGETNEQYAALGIDIGWKFDQSYSLRSQLFMGITDTANVFANLRVSQTMAEVPLFINAGLNSWMPVNTPPRPKGWIAANIGWNGIVESSEEPIKVNNNVYLEFEYSKYSQSFDNSVFLNGGYGYNPYHGTNVKFYPNLQFGVRIRIH